MTALHAFVGELNIDIAHRCVRVSLCEGTLAVVFRSDCVYRLLWQIHPDSVLDPVRSREHVSGLEQRNQEPVIQSLRN